MKLNKKGTVTAKAIAGSAMKNDASRVPCPEPGCRMTLRKDGLGSGAHRSWHRNQARKGLTSVSPEAPEAVVTAPAPRDTNPYAAVLTLKIARNDANLFAAMIGRGFAAFSENEQAEELMHGLKDQLISELAK